MQNITGFMVGSKSEREGIAKHGATGEVDLNVLPLQVDDEREIVRAGFFGVVLGFCSGVAQAGGDVGVVTFRVE